MRFFKLSTILGVTGLVVFLAGCGGSTSTPPVLTPAVSTPQATATGETTPAETATAVPPRTLVMCVQEEPQTLYVYGGASRSMWSILESIYDGPFDTRGYETQPVILQKIPSLADGDAVFQPRVVKAGDPVVDVNGSLVALEGGTRVMPSGCSNPACALSWDGASELAMDQLVVTFKLLSGIQWSDGLPLTASDSVYSYNLASDPATPVSKYLTDRTFAYMAPDEQTVEWTGVPGFYEQRYGSFFFLPLPEHTMGLFSPADLLANETVARSPMGWGPYVLEEWVDGDHITLRKNPNYFRAAEGLPKFDILVYRFIDSAGDGNMNALLSGECDVVDHNPDFVPMFPGLLERENQQKLLTYIGQGPEWEHLDFGIGPASYDDGYAASTGDRPDFFGDPRTRQAFAYCIDRASIVAGLLYNRSAVPNAYLPPNHPQYAEDLPGYAFNPQEGMRLLDEVGWKDLDGDPATPRVAAGVAGVPDGTPFAVAYLTSQASLRQKVAEAAAASLAGCGVQVQVRPNSPGEMFAPGPQGPVFGRSFDLVQFSWEASARPNCLLYASSQVPNPDNHWIGANITGYSSPEFDAACTSAYYSRVTDPDFTERSRQAQEIFARDLPVIPLYLNLKIAISRADLCGMQMDVTARSIFSNLEAFDYGEGCN